MYKKALFPIHIHQINIRENDILQNEVYAKIQHIQSKNELEIPEGWTTDKLFTSFSYDDLNVEIFNDTRCINEYYRYIQRLFDLNVKVGIDNLWFNYYVNGEWQEIHSHTGNSVFQYPATFSCIHFLRFDSSVHTPPIFVDPYESVRNVSLEMESNRYSSRYAPNVQEGDLIMFPSYLQHFVPRGEPTPDNPRITIAFNLKVLEYGNSRRTDN
tara:strand:- start:2262 stop:2900 length:639 start_codon:yes stop_codon:yes gene_type:complete